MLTKEECEEALENAIYTKIIIKDWKVLNKLIEEHFDPKPYKFEELKEGMWVFDSDYDVCRQIHKLYNNGSHNIVQFKSDHYPKLAKCYYFVENRFYPVQKANQGKEQ